MTVGIRSVLSEPDVIRHFVAALPLGAQIGLTIVAAFGAVGAVALGFVRLIERPGHPLQGLGYFALGILCFGLASLPAW
jgi:hypothetical protein